MDPAAAGNVDLLRGGWNQEFIEELILIPNGKYRDQADAAAGAYNKLVHRQRDITISRTVSRATLVRERFS